MFPVESEWIAKALSKCSPRQSKTVANLGSSTLEFRTVDQPHIEANVIKPLEDAGWTIVNIDLKEAEGVDLVADITQSSVREKYKESFELTICSNILEHVVDIDLAINSLVAITKRRGWILITVPYKYPRHLDPIDNMFRPTPAEIATRIKGLEFEIVDQEIIRVDDPNAYSVRKSRFPLWGYRNKLKYALGFRHKVSAILLQLK